MEVHPDMHERYYKEKASHSSKLYISYDIAKNKQVLVSVSSEQIYFFSELNNFWLLNTLWFFTHNVMYTEIFII